MKEMIKKYRGSLICSVLVMLIGVLGKPETTRVRVD